MPVVPLAFGFEKRHIFFDGAAHPDVRESLAYLIPLPEHGLGVIFYTWVHALGRDGQSRAGSAFIVYGPGVAEPVFEVSDDIFVPDSASFDDWTVGSAHLSMTDDMMSSALTFAGARVSLECTWEGLNPSFGFAANRGGCPQWLAWDRTEQGGRYKGRLVIDGKVIELDNRGHRDHSWGMRDWGGATHWKWWNILGPDSTAIHVMEVQAFGRTTVHGYVQKDGLMGTVMSFDADITYDDRMMHTNIELMILDDEGRTTEVSTRKGADLSWPVSPHLLLHEASMFATVDGREGVAYMELAWPPAYIAHHQKVGMGYTGDQSALVLQRD